MFTALLSTRAKQWPDLYAKSLQITQTYLKMAAGLYKINILAGPSLFGSQQKLVALRTIIKNKIAGWWRSGIENIVVGSGGIISVRCIVSPVCYCKCPAACSRDIYKDVVSQSNRCITQVGKKYGRTSITKLNRGCIQVNRIITDIKAGSHVTVLSILIPRVLLSKAALSGKTAYIITFDHYNCRCL